MKIALLTLLAATAVTGGHEPQERIYDVRLIPQGLRTNAAVVIRAKTMRIEIAGRGSAEVQGTVAYTIFRAEGRGFGRFSIRYDRFRQVKDLEGAIYDERGEEIRTLSGDDVSDESDMAAQSLYDDVRVRTAELFYDRYPYTVVFDWCVKYDGVLEFPPWVVQPSEEPVVYSRLEVVSRHEDTIRYWPDTLRPVTRFEEGRRLYVWEARNLPELAEGMLEEDLEQRTTVLRVAPNEFEFDGRHGIMSDWKSFGAWFQALYRGKTALPPQAIQEVRAAVTGVPSERERVRILYRYLQTRTRYVNVALGIGGWEPYDPSYVYERGYGDCKALSNFMVALLAEAGIRGYPALVSAGEERPGVIDRFPSNCFNHVIVCAPLGKDTVWLECT